MLIEFDIEKLEEVLYDFYQLTHATISLWDTQFNQLTFQPKEMPPFCARIKNSPYGCRECLKSDMAILVECSKTKKSVTHICHAGLSDTVVPILYENEIVGYVMFGQLKYENSVLDLKSITEFSEKAGLDVKLLIEEYKEISTRGDNYLQSATRILNACANYIILSNMIKVNNNFMPAKIDIYINNHIKEKITVESICESLFISKSTLYLVFKKNFNCTFGEYLLFKRIKIAKNLLSASDIPIYEICGNIGINDYNYFIKVFKKATGYPPSEYRKKFSSVNFFKKS